jgi:hypothetical protein
LTELAVMRNPLAQAVRNFGAKVVLGLSQVQHRISNSLTELEIAYPHSPLTVTGSRAPHHGNLPKAGERWAIAEPIGAGLHAAFCADRKSQAAGGVANRFAGLTELRKALRAWTNSGWCGRMATSVLRPGTTVPRQQKLILQILWLEASSGPFDQYDRAQLANFHVIAENFNDRGPSRASIIRLGSATISSVRLFSRLVGLSANAVVDPGPKIGALQPFPRGLPLSDIPCIPLLSLPAR